MGVSSSPRMFRSVDFPQPDGPMMATNSPCLMTMSTSSSAETPSCGYVFVSVAVAMTGTGDALIGTRPAASRRQASRHAGGGPRQSRRRSDRPRWAPTEHGRRDWALRRTVSRLEPLSAASGTTRTSVLVDEITNSAAKLAPGVTADRPSGGTSTLTRRSCLPLGAPVPVGSPASGVGPAGAPAPPLTEPPPPPAVPREVVGGVPAVGEPGAAAADSGPATRPSIDRPSGWRITTGTRAWGSSSAGASQDNST